MSDITIDHAPGGFAEDPDAESRLLQEIGKAHLELWRMIDTEPQDDIDDAEFTAAVHRRSALCRAHDERWGKK